MPGCGAGCHADLVIVSGGAPTAAPTEPLHRAPRSKPLCVKSAFRGAVERALAARRSVVLGPGSDLSEEPAVQDVEPVTLDFVDVPGCPPGPAVNGAAGLLGAGATRRR